MVIGLLVRGGLLVGTVYYTRKIGFWDNSIKTEELYNNVKSSVSPYALQVKKQLPFEVPALPQVGEVRFLAKHYYNQGVKETFHFLQMTPCYAGRLVKKTKDTFNDFANPPTPAVADVATITTSASKKQA